MLWGLASRLACQKVEADAPRPGNFEGVRGAQAAGREARTGDASATLTPREGFYFGRFSDESATCALQ